jgi:hypothetical protein
MVLAGKLFRLAEKADLGTVARKLKDFQRTEEAERDGKSFTLTTGVEELKKEEGGLRAVIARDYLLPVRTRAGPVPVQATARTGFSLWSRKEALLLFIQEKKHRANALAHTLSEVLLAGVVEARISPETLKRLHESRPEATKVIFFDDVDLPNIDTLALYGSALAHTKLYADYLKHGKIWYAVFETEFAGAEAPLTVGVTRNCIVTLFSKVPEETFLGYVRSAIVPLVE